MRNAPADRDFMEGVETVMLPNPIFTLGPLKVHMYGVMIAVGVLSAFIILQIYAKKKKLDGRFTDFLFYDAIVSVLVSFGSAVLFQAIYDYIKSPEKGFRLGDGMTFIGGLIGALIVFFGGYFLFRKKLTGRMIDLLPIFPCCITIAHGFGRIGCFFAGCCHGIHTGTWLDMKFPEHADGVLPTQLYEAVFLFLLFAVLSLLLLKKNCIYTMSIYLISYGVFRFAIEFVRDDERGAFIGALTPSQFWSVVMVAAGIALIFMIKKMKRKPAWSVPVSEEAEASASESASESGEAVSEEAGPLSKEQSEENTAESTGMPEGDAGKE